MAPTNNKNLLKWVAECEAMCKPDKIVWCDGTSKEYDEVAQLCVDGGYGQWLDAKKRPNSLIFRSDPSDVARVEGRTFIASKKQEDSGPTNNWEDPEKLKVIMKGLYDGCMKGRTMYVIPFSMGPIPSKMSRIGVEITDSPYVTINMHIMTRVGTKVLEKLGEAGEFVPCLHSIGAPLAKDENDVSWPCAPIEKKYISHFPEERLVWSYGSGYGGNALLGKKCFALRIGSFMAKKEGWLAEHMIILRLTSPEGKKYHVCAAFPSSCGKTNLAMITPPPTIGKWKAETIGDDIAWLHIGEDGKLWGINPENGFFGVLKDTSYKSNPIAMECMKENVIFTNPIHTKDNDVSWEGKDDGVTEGTDWKGEPWTAESGKAGAHPNARFTGYAKDCPMILKDEGGDGGWENPNGFPIDVMIFGGRRRDLVPLVCEARDWNHGVFMGAAASSETTSANISKEGVLRRDPFAMLPFCGYHMGDFFKHHIDVGAKLGENAPKVFYVNWFRRDAGNKFLWPGYGENMRILKWICDRVDKDKKVDAVETPIGLVPTPGSIDLSGLSDEEFDKTQMARLLDVNSLGWAGEYVSLVEHFKKFEPKLPEEIKTELEILRTKLVEEIEGDIASHETELGDYDEKVKRIVGALSGDDVEYMKNLLERRKKKLLVSVVDKRSVVRKYLKPYSEF